MECSGISDEIVRLRREGRLIALLSEKNAIGGRFLGFVAAVMTAPGFGQTRPHTISFRRTKNRLPSANT